MRIVSLISSATEIVCALGMRDRLVGRSHECDYPPSVAELPVCTEPKFAIDGTSVDIDQRVKRILQNATSVYRVHAEVLRELRPDIIVTQTQCEVCAVSKRDVDEAICSWLDQPTEIVSLAPNALADVWLDIQRVADALGAPERGRALVAELRGRMAAIAARTANLTYRPTVALIEWIDPLMTAGNWMPELVDMAGGIDLFGQAGQHAPRTSWEQLVVADPEVIIAQPCGFDLPRTRQEMATLAARPEWRRLRAVRDHRVFVTDGNQFFNRPGPRLVESLEILAGLLHPELFPLTDFTQYMFLLRKQESKA